MNGTISSHLERAYDVDVAAFGGIGPSESRVVKHSDTIGIVPDISVVRPDVKHPVQRPRTSHDEITSQKAYWETGDSHHCKAYAVLDAKGYEVPNRVVHKKKRCGVPCITKKCRGAVSLHPEL